MVQFFDPTKDDPQWDSKVAKRALHCVTKRQLKGAYEGHELYVRPFLNKDDRYREKYMHAQRFVEQYLSQNPEEDDCDI